MITTSVQATAPIKAKANNSRGVESGFQVANALVASTPTTIGLWELEQAHTEERPPKAAFYRPESLQVDESIVSEDKRTLVQAKHFAQGGKYRSIVKLMARMEGHDAQDPWMMGTGWLIAPDLIVTAGHMSFDWDHKFGFVKEMKAWIGYYGRNNVGDTSVQLRHGQTVATPAEWIKAPREQYDVSFIKVDKPFTGVKPMMYSDTPAKGNLNLGVVGYPGDLLSPGDAAYGEHMYEMFLQTQFDLATSNKLLQYKIDTFGGNSGSPVIVKDNLIAIGVHVLGGSSNSASVIGPLGNVFQVYKDSFNAKPDPAFHLATKVPSRIKSFRVVSIPSWNERNTNAANTESLSDSMSMLEGLHSLLDSSVHAPENPEVLLGKLQALLEPSMVSAMSDSCNGAKGLVKALRFLWDSSQDSKSNTESLLTTMARHKKKIGSAVIKHKGKVLKLGERVAELSPPGRILKYGMDAADIIANSNNNESLMDHVATGLSVTVPIVDKELPKLGSIGGPIATMAASALRSVGAQAAAAVNSDSEPSDPAPEGARVDSTPLPGAKDRAILAEAALHGIMRLDKRVLKQHQVFDKMHAIIRPLAPTIQRADSMLSSIMQLSIAKVAVASVNKASLSTDATEGAADATQQMTSAPQSPTAAQSPSSPQTPAPKVESAYYKNAGGVRPKIGVTVDFPRNNSSKDDASPTQAETQDGTPVDEPINALREALLAANPDLEDTLPGIVERGTQVHNDAFSNATMFGLPILLGNGKESEYEDQKDESVVAVTGLAQRAMLAEAALQVVLQLPTEIVSSLEVPNIGPTLDAFDTEDGHDESDQTPPTQSQAGLNTTIAAASGAVSGAVMNAGLGIYSIHRTHQDKLKEHEQKGRELDLKEKDQAQKDKDQELVMIQQNMTAHQMKVTPPHPGVKHYDSNGTLIVPEAHGGNGGGGPPRDPPRSPPRGPPRGGNAIRGGRQHAGTEQQQHRTRTSEERENPDSSRNPSSMSAKARGKQPSEQREPDKEKTLPNTEEPVHKEATEKHKPKREGPTTEEPVHKTTTEEDKPKREEPETEEPVHKATTEEDKPKKQPKPTEEPVHKATAEEDKPKREEPKTEEPVHKATTEEDKPKKQPKPEEHHGPSTTHKTVPGFARPTASSSAKKNKRESNESLLAEDFVSGFGAGDGDEDGAMEEE